MTLDVRSVPPIPFPLLTPTLPVSEIAITGCMMPPEFVGHMCEPGSSAEKDAIKGKWVRVDRDLNLEAGIWNLVRFRLRACDPR